MIKYIQILCLFVLLPIGMTGQFSDNFSDGDFTTNPSWSGDVDFFEVNDKFELQLKDNAAGSSSLFLDIELEENFTWEFDLKLNFKPSVNNRVKVFLFIDKKDINSANGFVMEYGENGSDDALHFYLLTDGTSTLLGSAEMGAVALKPAQVSIKIDRVDGLWTISTDYSKNGFPIEELSFFEDSHTGLTNGFFGLDAMYTISNSDEFYFDNLIGTVFVPDTQGPELSNFEIITNSEILLTFDESILQSSLDDFILDLSPSNNLIGKSIEGVIGNQMLLTFGNEFQSGPEYTATINGLMDEKNNIMMESTFSFVIAVTPSPGDIIINEILFNPPVEGNDFVELKNISSKILQLKDLIITNSIKENSDESIPSSLILLPNEIIAITADSAQVIKDYSPVNEAIFYETKIPAFNLDYGNVTISNSAGIIIDSFTYHEDFHLAIIDDVKGVSLERIYPKSATIPINFASGVKSTNYATPGYENKNSKAGITESNDLITLENEVFSPNNDGNDDQLLMAINLPGTGYLSTIQIFNVEGQIIKTVQNNQLTGQEDLARWDGSMDDGGKAPIGHYILFFSAFNEEGNVLKTKKHIKLLDFL